MSDSDSVAPCLGLTWGYDAWGNRNQQTPTAGTCASFNQTADANNHLPASSGYQYDPAGNLKYDGMHSYFYDAENRIIQVDGTLGTCSTATACYFYDALGHRVEKQTGSAWVSYLHDTAGHVVTEWCNSCGGTYTGWATGYVYVNAQFLAQYSNSTTYFATLDQIDSVRLLTAMDGSVAECHDYLPFGELISYPACTYGAADDQYQFAEYQRDWESNLDNAQARYYASALGRFMSPDRSDFPDSVPYADFQNPQTLNLYSYVENDPLGATDPTGHKNHLECDPDKSFVQQDGILIQAQTNCHIVNDPDPPSGLSDFEEYLVRSIKTLPAIATMLVMGPTLPVASAVRGGPPNPVCVATWAGTGGTIGAWAGGAGLVLDGVGEVVTVPAGGGAGALAGGTSGMILCSSSTGDGGGPAPPQRDASGKNHVDMPDHVPDNWTREQLEQAEYELKQSIKQREEEQLQFGEDGPHRARIEEERQLLRQIQKKLSGS
jgi:RHS repeat-associated protein